MRKRPTTPTRQSFPPTLSADQGTYCLESVRTVLFTIALSLAGNSVFKNPAPACISPRIEPRHAEGRTVRNQLPRKGADRAMSEIPIQHLVRKLTHRISTRFSFRGDERQGSVPLLNRV